MRILFNIILFFFCISTFAQTDQNGNPVFNSVTTGEEKLGDCKLLSDYYTLKNNIEIKSSSVYIADKPSLDEIENAAIKLPSDFFVLLKNDRAVNLIMVTNNPSRHFFVINPESKKTSQFNCTARGDVSQNRAHEMIKNNYDPEAKIEGNLLHFNKHKLQIISAQDIRKELLALIEKQHLMIGDTSGIKVASQDEIKHTILNESKEGGKIDFFTPIKGHEMDGIQIKPGLIGTRMEVALYKWGRANYTMGVNTLDDAYAIWVEFIGRPANQREKDSIKLGFNRELEK